MHIGNFNCDLKFINVIQILTNQDRRTERDVGAEMHRGFLVVINTYKISKFSNDVHFLQRFGCVHDWNKCTDVFLPPDLVCSLSILMRSLHRRLSVKAIKEKS